MVPAIQRMLGRMTVLSDAGDPQAFLSCFPLAQGHVIVAQRKHTWKKFSEKHFLGESNLDLIVLISLLPQLTQLDKKL